MGKNIQKTNKETINENLKRNYIDAKDDPTFRVCADICNCFGHSYKAWRKGGIDHPTKNNVHIWFPKLYLHKGWDNKISPDEKYIYEKNIDSNKNREMLHILINGTINIKYCFAQYRDINGRMLYHFKGEYTLDREQTLRETRAVWKRTNTTIKIYFI